MGADGVPQVYREKAAADYLLARARRETAEARASAEVYFAMAQLKASPDEYQVRQAGQEFVLVKKAKLVMRH